jgi:hypothetical protein
MLQDLRDLVDVLDRRLVQLPQHGASLELIANTEGLRSQMQAMIQQMEADQPKG